jgi:hypothetical protein
MKIYQPMLFVGLGGTGCKVGAEFERRLREELCGPDGKRLEEDMKGRPGGYLPYQLPSCLQFVYADLSAAELARVRKEVIPGAEHEIAARRTMRMMTDLVPNRLANSAEVAQSLRLHLGEEEIGWLPPREGDPRIGPLHTGAGQLPTVGRAVLFETLRRDPDAAVKGIADALAAINQSGADLQVVSKERHGRTDPINVFVVFSVAGGTGSGIFMDYLHLIGDVLQKGNKTFQIYPLVLMPSSFDGGKGGGRPAELNAGSSLIDLFRFVDDQNAHGSPDVVGGRGHDNTFAIRYPRPFERVEIAGNTVQTAFLFARPVGGVKRDDLTRSMVALMLSLIGAGSTDDQDDESTRGNGYQPFADDFINKSVERYQESETGVGRRGVSTSSVAALTTPLAEIADIVSSHLLSNAVVRLRQPGGRAERNFEEMGKFLVAAGLEPLQQARPLGRVPDGSETVGRDAITKRLNERARIIDGNIRDQPQQLTDTVVRLAHEFDPVHASGRRLREIDVFRLQRMLFGHRELVEQVDRDGFETLLESFRFPPPAPPGFAAGSPPQPHDLPRRLTSRLRWDDAAVQAVVRRQDGWYAWRSRQIWNTAWNDNHREWFRIWQDFKTGLRAVVGAFEEFADAEPQQFELRSKDLYKERVGVAYLLPPHDGGLDGFYDAVLDRLRETFKLLRNDHEDVMLQAILGADGWGPAYETGTPAAAVAVVRQRVKEAVSEAIRPRDRDRVALVPRMEDLLASAAQRRQSTVSDADLRQFRQKVAALVPGGFAPEGNAPLKVLFTYPAVKEDGELEAFLRREVNLPPDMLGEPEFRAIQADSMVVVFMRTSMGVTEVPEVRSVIKLWSEALVDDRAKDVLPWRQRLGGVSTYLLMTESDRARILQRLLCAAWNGQLVVRGDLRSPRSVAVDLGTREAVKMELDLRPLGGLSSWASLLQAYETWILVDDADVRRSLAKRLMETLPDRLATDPSAPDQVFTTVTELADDQLKRIRDASRDPVLRDDPQLLVFEEFWADTLRVALDLKLGSTSRTLRTLPLAVQGYADTADDARDGRTRTSDARDGTPGR